MAVVAFRNFLSPIDGYSDLPFRLLCQRHQADAICVPLVSATAIAFDESKTSLVDAHPEERNAGVQLVGNEPAHMGKAARAVMERFPFVSWLNINCGCPSARTMGCGGGSAMLAHPGKIAESVREMKRACDVPVSVKIRIKGDLEQTAALCRLVEEAGADFIIIHGRTAAQGYSGKADWGLIRALKLRLDVPLVGNGDIRSKEEGERLVEEGYCDSYMVARAAMGNPLFFEGKEPEGIAGRMTLLGDYVSLHRKHAGEPRLKDVKLKAVNFMSGIMGASRMRDSICRAASVEEVMRMQD